MNRWVSGWKEGRTNTNGKRKEERKDGQTAGEKKAGRTSLRKGVPRANMVSIGGRTEGQDEMAENGWI